MCYINCKKILILMPLELHYPQLIHQLVCHSDCYVNRNFVLILLSLMLSVLGLLLCKGNIRTCNFGEAE
jgi:hypothetical protein